MIRCDWREDENGNWETSCGKIFVLEYGTPADNEFHFCFYCGGALREEKYVDPDAPRAKRRKSKK